MAVPSRVDGAAGTVWDWRRSNFFVDLLHFCGFPGNLLTCANLAALPKTNGLISFQNSRKPSVSSVFCAMVSTTVPVRNRWIFPLAVGKVERVTGDWIHVPLVAPMCFNVCEQTESCSCSSPKQFGFSQDSGLSENLNERFLSGRFLSSHRSMYFAPEPVAGSV